MASAGTVVFIIVAFSLSMAGAAVIEWIGERIGGLRSGGSGGRGGGIAPWQHGPMPPHPGPHGRGVRRPRGRRPSAPRFGREPSGH
jgi:hypothetical protein